jgi:hypothetical protein
MRLRTTLMGSLPVEVLMSLVLPATSIFAVEPPTLAFADHLPNEAEARRKIWRGMSGFGGTVLMRALF